MILLVASVDVFVFTWVVSYGYINSLIIAWTGGGERETSVVEVIEDMFVATVEAI